MGLTRITSDGITDATIDTEDIGNLVITNAKVATSAAIAGTKISPDFGSQDILTTGDITLTNTQPKIIFNDTNNNPDYQIENVQGVFKIRDNTNSADRLAVNTDGHIDIGGNVDFGAGIDVTGAITSTGNLTITNTAPALVLVDSDHNSDFNIQASGGILAFNDSTNSETRLAINSSGIVTIGDDHTGAATLGADLAVANVAGANIVVGDTVSGEYLRLRATSQAAWVGSKSNHPLIFFTNDVSNERMKIDTNGRVLITNTLGLGGATSSPSGLLHAQTSSGEGLIKIIGATNGVIQLSAYNGDSTINFGDSSSDSPGKLNYDHGTDSLAIKTNGSERMVIDSSGNITANKNIVSANLPGRNVIVNGAMRIAQRGTSSSAVSVAGSYGSVDRMMMVGANLDELAFLQKQTSDGPDGFSKCFEFDVTTPENALDANDLVYMRHNVEGQNLKPFFNANGTGKDFTISFYVKAYQAGTYQLNIYKNDGSRFVSKTYTIASSGVWQRVELNFTGDTNTAGMVQTTGIGFSIAWILAAGTDYTTGSVQPTWGSWPGNSGFAAGQAVNVASSANNYWRITGIQLEIGDKATSFEHKLFSEDLAACQRYFFSITGDNATRSGVLGYANSSSEFRGVVHFPVTMRANPTLTGSATAAVIDSADDSASFNVNALNMSTVPQRNQAVVEVSTSSMTAGQCGQLEFRAANGFMKFDAEL